MASFVFANGILGSFIKDNTRIIHIDALRKNKMEENQYEDIPCMYWNRLSNCELNKLHEGSFVSIKGRIERNDEIGVYILVENLEYLSPPKKN